MQMYRFFTYKIPQISILLSLLILPGCISSSLWACAMVGLVTLLGIGCTALTQEKKPVPPVTQSVPIASVTNIESSPSASTSMQSTTLVDNNIDNENDLEAVPSAENTVAKSLSTTENENVPVSKEAPTSCQEFYASKTKYSEEIRAQWRCCISRAGCMNKDLYRPRVRKKGSQE